MPSALAAAPAAPAVLIVTPTSTMKVFRTAKCTVGHGVFAATARVGKRKLILQIKPFSGYHTYRLKRGTESGPYIPTFIQYTNTRGDDFASNFIPPFSVPNYGAITFSKDGKRMGLGFHPMFDVSGAHAITIAGGVLCRYAG